MDENPVTDPIVIPPALLAEVRAAAAEDQRPAVELMREAPSAI